MIMHRILAVLILLSLVNSASGEVTARKVTESEARKNWSVTFLHTYDSNVLVISSDAAVAVINLLQGDGHNVSYLYRMLDCSTGAISSGKGVLFDHPKSPEQSNPWISVGPFRIQWSYNVAGKGWIYYSPEIVRVQLANKKHFDGLVLRRFQHRKGEQDGADQPATGPESKPEDKEKPKPETKVRPQ